MSTQSMTQEQLDAHNFKMLRAFMGYVENGSSRTVKMSQDDATHKHCLYIGAQTFYGKSLNDCINKATDAGMHVHY